MIAAGVQEMKKGIITQIAETMAAREQAKANQPKVAKRIDVTPERGLLNKIVSAGMARRVVPVIDTLWNADQLTEAEYSALSYYRDQASRAEDDVCQSGPLDPEKIMGGGGSGHPVGGYLPATLTWSPAIAETARIERDLGSLLAIARSVALDDITLTQWCIQKHGGRERYDGKGRFVAIVPINEKRHIAMARMELRMAARRISR